MTTCCNLFNLLISQTEVDIFRFEIRVDYLADSVQVVKAHQALFGHDPNKRQWHTFVIVAFNYFKEIDAENFKYHYEVFAMGAMMQETIQ